MSSHLDFESVLQGCLSSFSGARRHPSMLQQLRAVVASWPRLQSQTWLGTVFLRGWVPCCGGRQGLRLLTFQYVAHDITSQISNVQCGSLPKYREPQYRPQYIIVLIMGTPRKGYPPILGNPHILRSSPTALQGSPFVPPTLGPLKPLLNPELNFGWGTP